MFRTLKENVNKMDKLIDYTIRPLRPSETYLLKYFLYEAIFIPEGMEPPSRDIVDLPELKVYIEGFGNKKDDCCLVAESAGKIIGAVWTRIMNDYGHVNDEAPSLAISLYAEYRNKGIGNHMMHEMMNLLEQKGYKRVSLSVQKANYAVNMYLKLGFKIIKETEEEFIMVKELIHQTSQYTIRKLESKDIPEMQNLFCSTVLNVNLRDYTPEEVADWASCGESLKKWETLLSKNYFVGAFNAQNIMVGFSSMNTDGYLHSMFVHKDWQGRGVATQLLSEVERLARHYGAIEITSEVSLTARSFFENNGYSVIRIQKRLANKLELTNFAMRKIL